MTYDLPPQTRTRDGRHRRVGVEIEFAGLTGHDAAKALTAALGGNVQENDGHRFMIEGSDLGDLTLELDTRFAHPSSEDTEPKMLKAARKTLGDLAQAVVPYELITPPLTMDVLPIVDRATNALRRAGAKGTGTHPFYAFGLHLNPEAYSLEADYLIRVIRAFVLRNRRLRARIRPDATRRLAGWADAYDRQYRHRILSPTYSPDTTQLIRDYVRANPGRNYDLDMLPLFAEVNQPLTTDLVGEMLSAPRPTFHYRLPDCRIDEPEWSVACDWNLWVGIERLAEDTKRLDRLCERARRPKKAKDPDVGALLLAGRA